MSDAIDIERIKDSQTRIIGIGGAGCNVIDLLYEDGDKQNCFIQLDSDVNIRSDRKGLFVQVGAELLHGLGTGRRPDLGKAAILEDIDIITKLLQGARKVIIVCGLGQGMGSGASPVVAEIAKELGITVFGVAATPFFFEPEERKQLAEAGIKRLKEYMDSLSIVSNNVVLEEAGRNSNFNELARISNHVMWEAVCDLLRGEER